MPRPPAVRLPSRRPSASLDVGPLDLVSLEAALAADLITASKSLQKKRKVTYLGKHASKSHIFDGKFNLKAWRRLWDLSQTLRALQELYKM